MSNVELCNDGRCKRVRMGLLRHNKDNFSSNFTRKAQWIKNVVTGLLIILMVYVVVFQFTPTNLEPNDKLTISIAIMAAIMSVVIAIINWHLKNKQLQTTSMTKIFELLSSHEIRQARDEVHKEYCRLKNNGKDITFRNSENVKMKDYVDLALSSFDQVSVLVLNGLVDDDLFFDAYGEMVVRDWKTLEVEIRLRQKKNSRTLKHFTELKNKFLVRVEEENSRRSKQARVDIEPYCDD